MSTGRGRGGGRPRAGVGATDRCSVLRDRGRKSSARRASAMLENCTKAKNGYLHRSRPRARSEYAPIAL
jgi:hypothetical protein